MSYAGRHIRFSGSRRPPEALNTDLKVFQTAQSLPTSRPVQQKQVCGQSHPVGAGGGVKGAHTWVHRLPGHRMWWIFPGTSSALNFAGRSVARCGMCRSPMHSTRTIPAQCSTPGAPDADIGHNSTCSRGCGVSPGRRCGVVQEMRVRLLVYGCVPPAGVRVRRSTGRCTSKSCSSRLGNCAYKALKPYTQSPS